MASGNSYEISRLLAEVASKGSTVSLEDKEARKDLVEIVRSLYLALESPVEIIIRNHWAESALDAVMRTAVDVDLFAKLAENDGTPKTTQSLAEATGVETSLLRRMLKHMAAMNYLQELDVDLFAPNPFTKSLGSVENAAGIVCCFDAVRHSHSAVPEFLAKTGYKNPTDPLHAPVHTGLRINTHFLEYTKQNPHLLTAFNHWISGYPKWRSAWYDPGCVLVDKVLGDGAKTDPDAVLLVDLGGGTGRDVVGLKKAYPDLPGKIILQDRENVISEIHAKGGLGEGIEAMEHDFFTPQPIKGARAYYLHSVLHNYPTPTVRTILSHIRAAMTPGYSKLLINDYVIPDKGAYWMSTALDLMMMAIYAAEERTESAWRELLRESGFRVVRVWEYERGTEGLVVAEVAE